MLQLEGVHKSFGDLHVLKGIDMSVERGQVVCVIGPSGSGKSTLLRCINMLEPPEAGRIFLEGKEITGPGRADVDYVRRRVGMVFQQFNLFPHMTAGRNVSIAQRKVLDRPKEEADAKSRALLERVGLARQAVRVPRAPVRRPAAARRDRPRAGDGPARDAVRRGHERARPGAGQGGARRDARAGLRGHDDGRRHARDGLRRATSRTASCSWTTAWWSSRATPSLIDNPREERTKRFLGLVLEH